MEKQKFKLFSKVWYSTTLEFVKVISFNSTNGEYICINKRRITLPNIKEADLSL